MQHLYSTSRDSSDNTYRCYAPCAWMPTQRCPPPAFGVLVGSRKESWSSVYWPPSTTGKTSTGARESPKWRWKKKKKTAQRQRAKGEGEVGIKTLRMERSEQMEELPTKHRHKAKPQRLSKTVVDRKIITYCGTSNDNNHCIYPTTTNTTSYFPSMKRQTQSHAGGNGARNANKRIPE